MSAEASVGEIAGHWAEQIAETVRVADEAQAKDGVVRQVSLSLVNAMHLVAALRDAKAHLNRPDGEKEMGK